MRRLFALSIIMLSVISQTANAYSIEQKLGVGLTFLDFRSLPAVSFRYGSSESLTTQMFLGFNTDSAEGAVALGIKAHHYAIQEDFINFFVGMGFQYLSAKTAGVASSGYEIDATFGAEFFIPSVRSLGLLLETGLAYRSLAGTQIKTMGNSFLLTSVHYYF